MSYEMKRFPYSGTVDADGHVLEPEDLWEEYLEERYKARGMRVRLNDEGFEVLEIDGRPSSQCGPGMLALMGAMGQQDLRPHPDRRYTATMPFGAGDAIQRMAMMERENLECTVLYPTLGLLWEIEVDEPELAQAYTRAYNRWIADFCRGSRGRLVPIAHLSLLDPESAAIELERAVKDGCKGAWVNAYHPRRVIHGNPVNDPVYAKACELDVPISIHPAFSKHSASDAFDWPSPSAREAHAEGAGGVGWGDAIWSRAIAQQALVSFMALGTFDRFPTLKLGVLEEGAGWVGSILDRLDAFSRSLNRHGRQLLASDYFRRQCFVSADPDEASAPYAIEHIGPDCFMWATDFPHPDHPHDWVDNLVRFVEPLTQTTRAKVLGKNVQRIFQLDYPSR